MESNLHNSYVFKALDAYPYELEETLEALNYALSYNPEDTYALALMGRVYAEQLQDYETAKQYYTAALAEQINAHQVYAHFIQALIWNDDFDEAKKLIDFAMKIKGIDKAVLSLKKAQIFEATKEYKKAIKLLKEAKKEALNNGFIDYVKGEIARVKEKTKPKKKEKKKKRKKRKCKK